MNACQRHRLNAPARMRGLTLLELMISLTLGLLITAVVGYVYVSSLQTYRAQDSLSRLQEGARYAFEIMGKDLRMAGATGCFIGSSTKTNTLTCNAEWYSDPFGFPFRGTDGVAPSVACPAASTPGNYINNTDSVSVLRADVANDNVVQSHDNTGATQITLNNVAIGVNANDLLVATNCSTRVSVFQATAVAGAVVTHAASGANATSDLGGADYLPGDRVYRLNAVTYYIGTNPAGEPALYRWVPQGVNAAPVAEELIEGVENMRISYGVDTTAAAPSDAEKVDAYLNAAQVSALGGSDADKWARVVSVRISLLMRTTEDGIAPSAQTYTFNGAATLAGDRRLRKVFTHVVKLRNR